MRTENRKKYRRDQTSPFCPNVELPKKRKLSTQHQYITPDVLFGVILITMQDWTLVPVNNLDEISTKLYRNLRTPPDQSKMEPGCDQQIELLSTLKPVASSNDHVGTSELPKCKTRSILPDKVISRIAGI